MNADPKPWPIQQWLDGDLDLLTASMAASLTTDPAVRMWGHFAYGEYVRAQVTRPESAFRMVGMCLS